MYRLVLLTILNHGAVFQDGPAEPAPARLTVILPAGARVYVNDVLAPYNGGSNSFNTPALDPGRKFSYVFQAEMVRGGVAVSDSKRVYFRAGDRTEVDFRDLGRPNTGTTDARSRRPAATTTLPGSPPPIPSLASMDPQGRVFLTYAVFKAVPTTALKTRTVNGLPETYTTTIYKWVAEQATRTLDAKNAEVQDAAGRRIAGRQLAELLAKETPVYLSAGDKVAPFYLQSMREGTLIVVAKDDPDTLPAPQSTTPSLPPSPDAKEERPALPVPAELSVKPPQPRQADANGLRPRGPAPSQKLARVSKEGKLRLTEKVLIFKNEERTKTERDSDGETREVKFTVTVPYTQDIESVHDLGEVQAFGTDGNKIDTAALVQRLADEAAVLVTYDGTMVDPYYLQVIRAETVILAIPSQLPLPKAAESGGT